MSPSAARFSSNKRPKAKARKASGRARAACSVPGKVFLLGEYSVLQGNTALIAALGPRFGLSAGRDTAGASKRTRGFHPDSPAGKLVALANERGVGLEIGVFRDPHEGLGGFGGSTAQFALAYAMLAPSMGWDLSALSARALYIDLAAMDAVTPSGADLVTQWTGGVVCYEPRSARVEQRFGDADWDRLLVFSAAAQKGRKVATHDHLARLARQGYGSWIGELSAVVRESVPRLSDAEVLGRAFGHYAEILAKAGFEIPEAREDRKALGKLGGVLGVKGSGALLADSVIVMLEPGIKPAQRKAVIAAARARKLKLVADGLGSRAEAGLLCP